MLLSIPFMNNPVLRYAFLFLAGCLVTGKVNESSMAVTFFKEPFHQENRLMENDALVSFP